MKSKNIGRTNISTESRLVKILGTDSLTDIALIKSFLYAEGVRYFIQGENMKFIRPGDQPARLMVQEEDVEKVVALLKPLNLNYVWLIWGKCPKS